MSTPSIFRRAGRAIYNFGRTDQHWARVVMDQELLKAVKSLPTTDLDILEISGGSWKNKCSFRSCRSVWFPSFNICEETLQDRYDLIIAEQVFEHLLNPAKALLNMRDMLKPQGIVIITTPFLLRVHPEPIDCFRWTPLGLTQLLTEAGFDASNITVKSWGNRACVRANLNRWARYSPWLHSLENEPCYPVVVWAIARIES